MIDDVTERRLIRAIVSRVGWVLRAMYGEPPRTVETAVLVAVLREVLERDGDELGLDAAGVELLVTGIARHLAELDGGDR